VKQLYREQWDLFRKSLWKSAILLLFVFIVSGIVSYFGFRKNENTVYSLMQSIWELFESRGLLDQGNTGLQLAVKLFFNNLTACVMVVLLGLIPIFLPSAFIVLFNGVILGATFAFLQMNGMDIGPMLFLGILPHGIFEIPAVVLSGALAFHLTMGIFRKSRYSIFSFKKVFMDTAMFFALICVPLLALAALIEAFITPSLMGIYF